jgi:hypothetical protein
MSGVSAPVVWAVIIVLMGGWLYHALVDHHGHLVLLRIVRPSTAVPETRHDSKWHAMSHPRRLLVNVMLTGAAILTGLAWELSPYVAAAVVIAWAVTAAVLVFVRRAGQPGAHSHEIRDAEGSKSLCRGPCSGGWPWLSCW